MTDVHLEGGPFDGQGLVMLGGLPPYLMLLEHPAARLTGHPLVVGAGFDDHWPGQQFYELAEGSNDDQATYRHVKAA